MVQDNDNDPFAALMPSSFKDAPKPIIVRPLPVTDYLEVKDVQFSDAVFTQTSPGQELRIRNHLKNRHLGLTLIIAVCDVVSIFPTQCNELGLTDPI